jgi:hypothetical protein
MNPADYPGLPAGVAARAGGIGVDGRKVTRIDLPLRLGHVTVTAALVGGADELRALSWLFADAARALEDAEPRRAAGERR